MQSATRINIALVILIAIVVALGLIMRPSNTKTSTKPYSEHFADKADKAVAVCPKATCGAIDPVSDPAYNMKEIAKQSILLEEHLAEKNKRCVDCLCKHWLHAIALAEEACMLCARKFEEYPYLEDSQVFYKQLFETWLANKEDEATITQTIEALRARRKEIVNAYYLSAPSPKQ